MEQRLSAALCEARWRLCHVWAALQLEVLQTDGIMNSLKTFIHCEIPSATHLISFIFLQVQ